MTSSSAANTLIQTAQQVVATLASGLSYHYHYVQIVIDGFGVNDTHLLPEHERKLDELISGSLHSLFAFQQGNPDTRLVGFVGMASQTGPESQNLELGLQRAQHVYAYLGSRVDPSQIDAYVDSIGSSRPRPGYDQEGSEFAQNRAVIVFLEIRYPIIGAVPVPPLPDTPPPEPQSREWSLALFASVETETGLNIIGCTVLLGILTNLRTNEQKNIAIFTGGIDAGISLATPGVVAGVNTQANEDGTFQTHWLTFEDFDGSYVVLTDASATNVAEFGDGAIGIYNANVVVSPPGIFLKSVAIGVGAKLQFGKFVIIESPDLWDELTGLIQ
ncbi:MAG: hypothetical protein AAF587_24715 [Bacteroidota bacterium]